MLEPLARPPMSEASDDGVDLITLAELLKSMGHPVRLELLRVLRFSHPLADIRVRAHRLDDRLSPNRPLAKQTVKEHLDKLVSKGLVAVDSTERRGQSLPQYTVNPARLYALIEDLRTLSTVFAGRAARDDATGTMPAKVPERSPDGPRLVLVHGVYEGKTFALDDITAHRGGRWMIGRGEEAAVRLDYDPYVSLRHADVSRRLRDFMITDLESKNRTRVNWDPLPHGGSVVLRPGDVINIGRSSLVFARA